MINGKIVTVVLPAYNAAKTLKQTYHEIPLDIVDHVILVDDYSNDNTAEIARELGIKHIIKHDRNKGYGGNQKTCYQAALELNSDIVVMLHPDYQYTPKLIPAFVSLLASGLYDIVFGSRILGGGALKGGMPLYKYIANRLLTMVQNILMGQKLSEYHTGFRAFSANALKSVDFLALSDDFIFDNQIIAQLFDAGFQIAEVTCPTRYFKEASSINFRRSIRYGIGVLGVSVRYFLHRNNLWKCGYLK